MSEQHICLTKRGRESIPSFIFSGLGEHPANKKRLKKKNLKGEPYHFKQVMQQNKNLPQHSSIFNKKIIAYQRQQLPRIIRREKIVFNFFSFF